MNKLKRVIYFFIKRIIQGNQKPKQYKTFGTFKDSYQNQFDLLLGLRDDLKKGWQTMLNPDNAIKMPTEKELQQSVAYSIRKTREIVNFLEKRSIKTRDKKILEIGCYDGSKSFALAECGARQVVGSDVSKYYINERINEKLSKKSSTRQNNFLYKLREKIRTSPLGMSSFPNFHKVSFVEDDISSSKLPSHSFDMIFSFEVLEHLIDPKSSFSAMSRLLKNGGYAVHEYNPFFCLIGGHSLCTLDFLWGHARLNEQDFYRYIRQIRPREVKLAKLFYQKNLNRMSLLDLKKYSAQNNLEIVEIITWPNKNDYQKVNREIFEQIKKIYPSITIDDLITPAIWVIQRKIK